MLHQVHFVFFCQSRLRYCETSPQYVRCQCTDHLMVLSYRCRLLPDLLRDEQLPLYPSLDKCL